VPDRHERLCWCFGQGGSPIGDGGKAVGCWAKARRARSFQHINGAWLDHERWAMTADMLQGGPHRPAAT
jgi:hypothetical protein